MKKRIIIAIFIVLLIIIAIYYYINNIYSNNKYVSEEVKSFVNLIKYRTDSINDSEKLDKILENMELGQYISKLEKSTENGDEHLTVCYTFKEEELTEDMKEDIISKGVGNQSFMQKNAVILFALINDLDKVTYNYYGVLSNKDEIYSMEYDRGMIELFFNQDVRDYVNNPNDFLKYNIDTNTNHIDIYINRMHTEGVMGYKKIEITDEIRVNTIVDMIENQNFGIQDIYTWGTINIWVDLNNGYTIGLYNAKEFPNMGRIINDNRFNENQIDIDKVLPKGLEEYIIDIINQHSPND